MIPFKMMSNMSMLRHQFSDERCGGGGHPEPPSSLILQKCVLSIDDYAKDGGPGVV